MTPVHLDDLAEDDPLQITERLSAHAADQFVAGFWSVVEQLRRFPESGQPSVEDPAQRVVRRGVYRFLYHRGPEDVLLIRILDGRGQPKLP